MKLKDFLSLFIGNTDVTIEAEQEEIDIAEEY